MVQFVSGLKSGATPLVLTQKEEGKDLSGRTITVETALLEDLDEAGIGCYEKGALSSIVITSILFFSALACLVAALFAPAVSIPLFLASFSLGAAALLLTPVNIALYAKS